MSIVNDITTRFISETSVEKKPVQKQEEDDTGDGAVRDLSLTVSEFIQNINSDDNSREGSDSQERNTNEVGAQDIEAQDPNVAAFTGLEANIAQKPLIINNATIASLGEMYPHNDGITDLQSSLTETINSGRKIEDMPEEVKDQLKLIFNPK
jgi:hypothetical protein